MSDLRRAVETELKFRVATPGAADRLLAADELGGLVAEGVPRTEQQDDRYLDTADAALARAGFALRIRQHAGQSIVGNVATLSGRSRSVSCCWVSRRTRPGSSVLP